MTRYKRENDGRRSELDKLRRKLRVSESAIENLF